MDDADRAQDYQGKFNASGVAEVVARSQGPGSVICVDCKEPIPTERRATIPTAVRCVDCQEEAEKQRGRECLI